MDSGSLPDSFALFEQNGKLVVRRRLIGSNRFLMVAILLFWWFVIPPYLLHILIDIRLPDPLLNGPYIHAIIGFGLVYITAVFWLNHSRIQITGSGIALKQAPIPWFGRISVQAETIDQIQSEGIPVRNWYGKSATQYEISIRCQNKKKIPIMADIDTAEQANILKSKFQDYLKIGLTE